MTSASHADVDRGALRSVLMQADKVTVASGWAEDAEILYSSTEYEDIEEFRQAARPDTSTGEFYCACIGSPVVRLYSGNEEILAISNHHGRSMRNSLWANNVRLEDPDAWVAWFERRGIPQPREELEYSIRLAEKAETNEKRWLQSMPPSLAPLWAQTNLNSTLMELDPFRAALENAYPDKYVRILALLEWYGSGAGPWSGYPSYESYVEKLLLDFPTPELVTAVEGASLTARQVEGAARLFGGWSFNQKRPDDLALVPSHLKSTLLEHELQSDDEDKRARAIAAFQR
jgi:hypothetical protein